MIPSDALKTLLLALADDDLIMGHRASEWTGMGPLLEADLALSSMAQDEMGHALLFYTLLEQLGEADPDTLVYYRGPSDYRNAILCELGRSDWGETVMRHFLYDLAEQIRLNALAKSTYQPLAAIARKIRPEERYHMLHGTTWLKRLGQGTEESHQRMQHALDKLLPYALGLWEPIPGEEMLVADCIMPPSTELRDSWFEAVTNALAGTFRLPPLAQIVAIEGGRQGTHSAELTQLLDAMQLLHRQIPGATW
ncbi:MAG: 1,2-phenylacetyl-CoA epoxidase subunit PaaC [Ardenticatenaceae bacterium]